MTTLLEVELGVLGPLQVRRDGVPVTIPGAKPRAILTMLGLHVGSVVSADTLVELLWGEDPPRTAAKALQTHISSLRRALGDGFVLTEGGGWTLAESEVDASRYKSAARRGRDAAAAGDTGLAVARFEEALALWRGIPELPDGRRGTSEKTRWIEGHAALVEDRADALLATGRAAEIIGELEAAVADAPLRERRWGQLMLALYRAGRQGEALGAYQRARTLLADELGVDPGPELRRLETAIVAQDTALEMPGAQDVSGVTRAVTFLLTDIEGSTAAWEAEAEAMGVALARHDELVEQVVTSRGGRLIKTRGEGDATFSVFERPSAAAAAALELQDAIVHEPWALREPMRVRVALHTGEAELRGGDYFGRAVNRAARLRSLAAGGQILCSGATAELVIDSLPDDVVLADLGTRQLKNLARPEHVFELRLETAQDRGEEATSKAPLERPSLPAVLSGPGPFVGRRRELEQLFSAWQTALASGTNAVLIAGEPGVGKTRLAGEWSRQAYDQGALVIYGRCDEDLGAPYQPFAEALRSLAPSLGASRLRGLRGVEALLPLVPGLTDVLPDLAAPTRADPDTERYALFDAVVALLGVASASAPVVLILDDLHWAAKPTLLLLRHLLRFGERARVQIIGTYRGTDLDRSHPLSAMLADLHRDGSASRLQLGGLEEDDVTAYVAEAGYNDEELARALASVTGGNPFFLIEALRHVDESGGRWDQSTLPQGVREAVSRRLSRLTPETNKALAAAAVVGSRFALELVERVVGDDLVDPFDEACKAGIVIEEPGGRYRFNHALVRQSLLAELPSVRRMRLHQRIATTLENEPGADDELLAELAHHYFECAWAGNAVKAVEYCRRAADQAMARLAYEGAAELYDRALHALEEIDDELPDRDDQTAELLIARCEALLAAGDVTSAPGAVSQLQSATVDSARLAAWATCFDGQLSMLTHPERLDEIEPAVGAAAEALAGLDDAAGEAMAHTVRAGCLARLGRIGDCEIALDDALTAARRAREHRRVNAVLANAPLAALWGPNPVPRAGGRCLDVVRLLRITTDSPAVEATSTRCQAVLEAFRGRAAAARRMIDSARRTVTELGLRHARLEVEQFAGIVELVVDDPAAAEPHLRKAYNGFRRMGLDADTAETAALLGLACLTLGRDAEADELCTESERLAGHALKPSIAWRTLRARLLSRGGDHDEARRVAEAAVSLAEQTDALVDHGDACLSLATVLGAAGDVAGARVAAERAVGLYERKGAAALAERARQILGAEHRTLPAPPEPPPQVEPDSACVRAGERMSAAYERQAWDEVAEMYSPNAFIESRRKVVGFTQMASSDWVPAQGPMFETGAVRVNQGVIAVRGERLALSRLRVGSADVSPGAPYDEFLSLYGIDEEGRFDLQVWFDVEDVDAALAELDATDARFEREGHRQPGRLETAATGICQRFASYLVAGDWGGMAESLADNIAQDDRRRLVGGGLLNGRDAVLAEIAVVAPGIKSMTTDVIATRGEHLVLNRVRSSFRDEGPGAFGIDVLDVVEIDADERVVARIVFDLEDFDAAIAELDARYLAGDAAPFAHSWTVITSEFAALNRRELPATAPDWVNIDHRRGASFARGEMFELLRAAWNRASDLTNFIEAVHRLNEFGGVITHVARETSEEGFHAEWRVHSVFTLQGDVINRCEVFDDADLDPAIARFDQLSGPTPRLENAAIRMLERYFARFAARDWDVMAETLTDDFLTNDRRRVVNAGVRRGRDAEIANMQSFGEIGIISIAPTAIATRGERLVLCRHYVSFRDWAESASGVIGVVEITNTQISAHVMFDVDDIDAAVAELDARYLAGEAAPYARTWSVVTAAYAAHSREFPPVTPDWVNIDHRRVTTVAPGDMVEYVRAGWDLAQGGSAYIEAVHRLNNLGVVFTHLVRTTSPEGFDAQWREVIFLTLEGELINRCELFDEEDLDAAIARFEQLSRPAPRLENAASRVDERFQTCFAARDWDAMGEILADDISADDRRRVVNAGIRRGRDAKIADMRATADLGTTKGTSTVIALRGERLALVRIRLSGRDQRPDAFQTEMLGIAEVNADNRMTARVLFDSDDFDAAIAELDARYLAGEAAAHAHTWSVVVDGYAALNRHELTATAADVVTIDHRRVAAFAPGEGIAYARAGLDLVQHTRTYVEAVHRLTDLGVVCTHIGQQTSQEGLDAEWRIAVIYGVRGDLINRFEAFDEVDLDTAITRFEQLHPSTPRLENTATRVFERLYAHIAARDWDAVGQTAAENVSVDDRRRVVNAGVRLGRDDAIENARATVDVGFTMTVVGALATRGDRVALTRVRVWGRHPDAVQNDVLSMVEIDTDDRIVAVVVFDLDGTDAAFAELDARYLTGEAAAHARSWSVIAGVFVAHNRRELPAMTPDAVSIDHRREAAFAPGEGFEYIRAGWDLDQNLNIYIETAHRLNGLGAVFTWTGQGTSHEGFDAEWRGVTLMTVGGEMVSRMEVFDEADLDSALARFDQISWPAPRLENAASQAYGRFRKCFAARDWATMAELLTADTSVDDHRRVVSAEIRRGRDIEIANMQAFADVGAKKSTATVIATRGERLVLCRTCIAGEDEQPGAFDIEFLNVVEITADERIAARSAFELDDFDAAFAYLDARYLVGEAAAYARTWSVITHANSAVNRHETLPITPDCSTIDHRLRATFGADDLSAYIHAQWELTPDLSVFTESVHRLSDLGAIVTQSSHGTSQEGLDAEWRQITLMTVEGDLGNRCEIFDEADLDVALARWDELSRPALRNAASQAYERICECLETRDWNVVAELCAENVSVDDRRRVVNAGIRTGRDAAVKDLQVAAEMSFTYKMLSVIATRGDRLALMRVRGAGRDPGAFTNEVPNVVELDSDGRIVAAVVFDLEDIDAAFAELDARYLAGEAAACSRTWSVITGSYAAINRREQPAITPDWITVDHRRETAMGPGDLVAYIASNPVQDNTSYVETVHRLDNRGALVTYAAHETSQHGFNAEWRGLAVFTVEGDMVNRCEVFDEADLDVAIARFDEVSRPAPRPENAATRVNERIWACFDTREWDKMSAIFADDMLHDDRRRIVGAGVLHGRDAQMQDMRVYADIGINPTINVIATRGERVALTRARFSGLDHEPQDFIAEALIIVEIDADERMSRVVAFDPDDFDAAFEELDARYIAGEAAAHAHTWSVIARGYAALNRRELPAIPPDFVSIDHRRGLPFPPGELMAYLRAGWDAGQGIREYAEVVHRLSDLGAVDTHVGYWTSPEGFVAEWRGVDFMTVEGDMVNHTEVFDEADLDVAIAKFDELSRPAPRPENAASHVARRFLAHFAARDWDAMAELLTDDISSDDRRRTVNAGVRRGRDAEMANWRATADIWTTQVESTMVATRGERLVLIKVAFTSQDRSSDAFDAAAFAILEINDDHRIAVDVVFDLDNIDAAFEELDALYLAGEAATHAHFWSVVTDGYATLNKHQLPSWTSDWLTIDHRMRATFEAANQTAYIRGAWDLTPNLKMYIESVHRLSDVGAVVTHAAYGSTQEGFDAEWRMIELLASGDDTISRCELFDETDLNSALARFDELQPPRRRLENAASQAVTREWACFAARDWAAMAETMSADFSTHDHRRVVNAGVLRGRDAHIANYQAVAEVGFEDIASTVLATRGQRLAVIRVWSSARGFAPGETGPEMIGIVEVDADHRLTAAALFDVDDIDAAFEELDARYLAGEAAAHAQTWSVIAGIPARFNRQELFPTTTDPVYIDHRPLVSIEGADLAASIRAVWELTSNASVYIEAVHQLSEHGAVFTEVLNMTSRDGFDAEVRMIMMFTVEGDLISGVEVFDEANLDGALARFEELQPETRRLVNTASQVAERVWTCFAAHDWDALAELFTEDISADDRRRVVNAGVFRGRDAQIANMRAMTEFARCVTSTVIATRGERLALNCLCVSSPNEFSGEYLSIIEIDADNRAVAGIQFDPDDIDTAFKELDARYLAGEAASCAHTWSVIAGIHATYNRRELPPTTPDWVNIDHRRGTAVPPGDLIAYVRASWDDTPGIRTRIEAVHRLSILGAVVTSATRGTTKEGLDAEWLQITLLTFEGDLINRCETFDEADLDAALARFDELNQPPLLENSATRTWRRISDTYNRRDLEGFLALGSAGVRFEDRRKGLRDVWHGPVRRKAVEAIFEIAPSGWQMTVEPIAIRGSRLSLTRACYRETEDADRPIAAELLHVTEVGDDGLIHETVSFDPDDLNDAFAELTARWIASGEVANPEVVQEIRRLNEIVNGHDWDAFAARIAGAMYVNHRQLDPPDAQNIADHMSSIRMLGALVPDYCVEPAEILAQSATGLVDYEVLRGTSTDGVSIEIPLIVLILLDGGRVTRLEVFDPDQRDLALSRFSDLNRPG